MNYTIREIRVLARAYLDAHPDMKPTKLSRKIVGAPDSSSGHHKLIGRLLEGRSCLMEHGEMASAWFEENWPQDVPWPLPNGHP